VTLAICLNVESMLLLVAQKLSGSRTAHVRASPRDL
jgi:hypothetical protein